MYKMAKESKINIQGVENIDDFHYRYMMTKLHVIKQRNKTIVDNLAIVAADLDRNPSMIADYFKKRLSVSMTYKNDILTTTANIEYDQFETMLREFIEVYVLCNICKLPETVFMIRDNNPCLECKCCSNRSIIQ